MNNNIYYQGTIKGKAPLFKFQTAEIIEKIINGSFYMNSLKNFREKYQNSGDDEIGDPFEGQIYTKDAEITIDTPDGNHSLLDQDLLGTAVQDDFVFCMFGFNPQLNKELTFTEEQKKKWLEIYDTALIINDQSEFFKRITQAANAKNVEITCGFVQYYDEKKDVPNILYNAIIKGMKTIAYYKRKKYSYQQEFRFLCSNTNNEDHLLLNIGNISDITTVIPLDKFFNAKITKIEN